MEPCKDFGRVNVPVIAFAIGAIIKLIFNLILIPIKSIGANGAIISSILSHFASFIICFISLKKNINIDFKIDKFLIKPVICSIIMATTSYILYNKLNISMEQNIAFICSLLIGIIVYIILIFLLKILSEEEIFMIPYGQKIYKMVRKSKKWKMLKTVKNKGFYSLKILEA